MAGNPTLIEPLTSRDQELHALSLLAMGRSVLVLSVRAGTEDALDRTARRVVLVDEDLVDRVLPPPPRERFDLVLLDRYTDYVKTRRHCLLALPLLAWGALLVASNYDRVEVERAMTELLGSPHNLQFTLATWWAGKRRD